SRPSWPATSPPMTGGSPPPRDLARGRPCWSPAQGPKRWRPARGSGAWGEGRSAGTGGGPGGGGRNGTGTGAPGAGAGNPAATGPGAGNLAATVPAAASAAFARNVSSLLLHMVSDGELAIDVSDDIQAGVVIAHDGKVVHPATAALLAGAPEGGSQ